MKCKISVIVPVYNVKPYLPKCIGSLLGQTFSDYEIILVDDGSLDGSGDLCDMYAEQDNIRVIHQKNGGLSAARNTGTVYADGEYLTYLDSDDYVAPRYLECLYHNIIKYKADVSVCGYRLAWEHEDGTVTEEKEKKEQVMEYCISGHAAAARIVEKNERGMIVAWGKLYHRKWKELLVYPEGRINEDEFVTYKILYESRHVAVTTRKYYCYRQREGSIMSEGYNERRLDKLAALRECAEYFEKKGDRRETAYARKRYLLNVQISWYRVWKYMPNRKKLLTHLEQEHRKYYRRYNRCIRRAENAADRIAVMIFRLCPRIYAGICEVVLKLNPQI